MNYPKDRNIHRPPHMYLDDYIYFITTKTLNFIKLFNTYQKKVILNSVFWKSVGRFNVAVYAWVFLDNHYHLLIKIDKGIEYPKFIQNFHCNSSRILNKLDNQVGRRIWYQYQDHCIRGERDFWVHFNYIHHNPVKHRYVNDSKNYPFSSYNYWLNKKGREWLDSCFAEYPIKDYTPRTV